MLDFCAKHEIVSDVEVIPMQEINEAYERMLKGREVPIRDRHGVERPASLHSLTDEGLNRETRLRKLVKEASEVRRHYNGRSLRVVKDDGATLLALVNKEEPALRIRHCEPQARKLTISSFICFDFLGSQPPVPNIANRRLTSYLDVAVLRLFDVHAVEARKDRRQERRKRATTMRLVAVCKDLNAW